jgi:hypothetical protein
VHVPAQNQALFAPDGLTKHGQDNKTLSLVCRAVEPEKSATFPDHAPGKFPETPRVQNQKDSDFASVRRGAANNPAMLRQSPVYA